MASPKVRVGDVVMVEWVDAVCDSSEIAAYEASGLPKVKTYGEVLEVTDKALRVAGERLSNSTGSTTFRCVTTIPMTWRERIVKLGSGEL